MIQVRVQSLGMDQVTKSPVVLLQEAEGDRVLPIWIGPAEASAIAMHLAGMKFARPLTHDLFGSMVAGLGGTITRALITRVHDNTYFAELVIQRGDEVFTVDARPSDSIAIALRAEAALFAAEALFAAHGAEQPGAGDIPPMGEGDEAADAPPTLNADALKEHLRKLNPEDLGRFNL